MTIPEPKFKNGQIVFFMKDNTIKSCKIHDIRRTVTISPLYIPTDGTTQQFDYNNPKTYIKDEYDLCGFGYWSDRVLFATKQELIATL